MNDACMTTPEALLARDGERLVFDAPVSQVDRPTHYCPGCHHGIAHRLVAEVLDELDVADRTILVASVGCSAFSYDYFDVDAVEAPHGRACAVATGVRRANPGSVIFTYQGDGDMAAIGLAESVHAANRGELITAVFINNTVYGMTGGQMAPTTLVGMKTATCPYGRDPLIHGFPLKITELAAQLEGTAYVTRQSVHNPAAIKKAKKALRHAFENSMQGKGSNLIEFVATCSSGWKMSPVKANEWMEEHMFDFYHVGDLKDK